MDKYVALEIVKELRNLSTYDKCYDLKHKALEQAWITLAAQGGEYTPNSPSILNPRSWSHSFGEVHYGENH